MKQMQIAMYNGEIPPPVNRNNTLLLDFVKGIPDYCSTYFIAPAEVILENDGVLLISAHLKGAVLTIPIMAIPLITRFRIELTLKTWEGRISSALTPSCYRFISIYNKAYNLPANRVAYNSAIINTKCLYCCTIPAYFNGQPSKFGKLQIDYNSKFSSMFNAIPYSSKISADYGYNSIYNGAKTDAMLNLDISCQAYTAYSGSLRYCKIKECKIIYESNDMKALQKTLPYALNSYTEF